jgi:hypothetical protein
VDFEGSKSSLSIVGVAGVQVDGDDNTARIDSAEACAGLIIMLRVNRVRRAMLLAN